MTSSVDGLQPGASSREAGRAVRAAWWGRAFGAALLLAAVMLPLWGEPNWQREFVDFACYLVFAMMWNLLAGFGGMVSIGQQAYFGIGGYVMVSLANFGGVNPFVAVPLGALAAGIAALPLSKVAFRLQGAHFAIGTWVIAEVCRLGVANLSVLGGGSGTSLTALRGIDRVWRQNMTYWLALAAVVLTLALVVGLLRSRHGLALMAIRDNRTAAASQGVAVGRSMLAVYLLAAVGAGWAGALYFLGHLRISPDAAFSVNWTAFAIFMVVIGGVGRIEGPLVGAALFWACNKLFSDYGTVYLMGLGLAAVLVTLLCPGGVWGWVERRGGGSLFAARRTLNTPITETSSSSGPSSC